MLTPSRRLSKVFSNGVGGSKLNFPANGGGISDSIFKAPLPRQQQGEFRKLVRWPCAEGTGKGGEPVTATKAAALMADLVRIRGRRRKLPPAVGESKFSFESIS